MRILVCVKQVPDPQKVRMEETTKRIGGGQDPERRWSAGPCDGGDHGPGPGSDGSA